MRGGSRSGLWRQIVADVFDAAVVRPTEPETAALGAAIKAGTITAAEEPTAMLTAAPEPPRTATSSSGGTAAVFETIKTVCALCSVGLRQLHPRMENSVRGSFT